MKSQIDIINESEKYFHGRKDRQSRTTDGLGQYQSPDGSRCIIGRLMKSPLDPIFNSLKAISVVMKNRDIDSYLKPEYCGHPLHFWTNLQYFYDNKLNWLPNQEISPRGRERLIAMRRQAYGVGI